MTGSSAFCCFPVDIAVRLIGSITLLTNVFVFIALVSHPDKVFADDKIRIVFGFDSQFFNADNRSLDDAEWFPIFCPVFALTDAVASALLIWASIIVQRWLTVPWLFCSVFNVFCHLTSLTMLSFRRLPSYNEWVTALTVLHAAFYVLYNVGKLGRIKRTSLFFTCEPMTVWTVISVASLYFTLIVAIAHYLWWIQSKDTENSPGNQELWENVYKSSPLFEGPYKNQV